MKNAITKLLDKLNGQPRVTLKRVFEGGCTVGILNTPKNNKLFTIEPPWRNNLVNVSCIPKGVYLCQKSRYNRGGYDTFEIIVKDRSEVKFHIGNDLDDTKGCPLVNDKIGAENGIIRGVESKRAFNEFYKEMKEFDQFILEVL